MQDYRKLKVWQKAHDLVVNVYADSARHLRVPDAWPVRDQMRPAAISIPSNIAEGTGRGSDKDFRRFLFHSLGSANELEYDFLLARTSASCPFRSTTRGLVRLRKFAACSRVSCSNWHSTLEGGG
jgi:four helix bundle protein